MIVDERGIVDKFDSVLLGTSNEKVIGRFAYELTHVPNPLKMKYRR